MGKRLTLSEQLIALQQQCAAQAERFEALQKELTSANNNKDYYYKLYQDANKELEDLHAVLDVVPGALPRKGPEDSYGKTYGAMLRLTVYFANQGKIKGECK